MYNAYPYFLLKIWAKKCALHTTKYSKSFTIYGATFEGHYKFDNLY